MEKKEKKILYTIICMCSNLGIANEEEKLSFYLCDPSCFWKTIIINKKSKFELVKTVLPKDYDYTFVFKGEIINPNRSFEDVGVKNGNTIIVIKHEKNKEKSIDSKWIKLSMDTAFDKKLQILSNKGSKGEYDRLSDIRQMKYEGSLKIYKTRMHKKYIYTMEESKEESEIKYNPNHGYVRPTSPCTEKMPVMWEA